MSDLSGAFMQIPILLIVICVGYVATKLGYLTNEGYRSINSLLIHIALPCLIISSVDGLDPSAGAARVPAAFGMAFLQFALLLLVTWLCNVILRTPGWQRPIYLFGNICTNTGFICLPILASIYGDETILISSIYVLVCNLVIGTVGMAILASSDPEQADGTGKALAIGKRRIVLPRLSLKQLLNAPLVACLIALTLFFGGVELPAVMAEPIDLIGRICTPLALMIVGCALAQSNLKTVFSEWRFYPFMLIRQIALPALSLLALVQWISDPVLLQVWVIMGAAPAGSMIAAWVDTYNQDGIWAAKMTVVTTLGFFVILSLLIGLMGVVL